MLASALAIITILSLGSVSRAAAVGPVPKPARPSKSETYKSYVETIPGTLIRFEMKSILAGRIALADPVKKGATRLVKIKFLWMGKAEVTWDEYDVFVYRLDEPEKTSTQGTDAVSRPSKPYGAADRGFGHKGYPVINVSYYGAEQYCRWLSLKTGKKYRLPTEAEWEYACRAGMPEPDKARLAEYAWYWQEKTQPVASKSPNTWSLHDMLGNVGEWCTDLSGKPVLCGGSYQDMAVKLRPSARQYQDENWQANDPQNPKSKWWLSDGPFVGFRIVRER